MADIKRGDMTEGTVWRHIFFFSLPIMAGNLLQQLYNTVDGIVVGNYVSQSALAATGTAGTLAMVFLAFAIGFGNGSGIMISQYYGARQYDELRGAVSTALILLVGIGLFFSLFGCIFSRFLLHRLMNVSEGAVLDAAVTYFAIYAVGLVLQFVYNAVAAILRAVGDSKATLYFLLVSSVLNLILDLVFVIVFHWGVAGAAIATVVSQLGSAIVSVVYMFKKYPIFHFGKGEFVFRRDKCLLCLKLGIPTTVQQSIVGFGHVFIQRLVNSFGEATMAAYTVGSRIENYLFVPAVGYNNGLATFSAQNIGARRLDRVRKGCRSTMVMTVITAIVLEVVSNVFAVSLSRLFGVDGDALALAVDYVRFLSCFFWIFSVYLAFVALLQGTGDVMIAMFCSMLTLGVRVILAYGLVNLFGSGCHVIWRVMPIGWAAALILAAGRYFSGKWKTKGVVHHG